MSCYFSWLERGLIYSRLPSWLILFYTMKRGKRWNDSAGFYRASAGISTTSPPPPRKRFLYIEKSLDHHQRKGFSCNTPRLNRDSRTRALFKWGALLLPPWYYRAFILCQNRLWWEGKSRKLGIWKMNIIVMRVSEVMVQVWSD